MKQYQKLRKRSYPLKKKEKLNSENRNTLQEIQLLNPNPHILQVESELVEVLIKKRKSLGLSQNDLAELCLLPAAEIQAMETNKAFPSVYTLLRVSRKLGEQVHVVSK